MQHVNVRLQALLEKGSESHAGGGGQEERWRDGGGCAEGGKFWKITNGESLCSL